MIIVEDISKNYTVKVKGENLFKKRKIEIINAVSNVSFNVNPGEIMGYIGMNGAGKTTTMKMLSGILKPDSGKIKILGDNPFKRDENLLKKLTFISGNKSQLWWDLPAYDTFVLNKKIYDIPDTTFNDRLDDITRVLNSHGLMNKPVRKLSLGEKMKMELTASLLHKPDILFLDEPTIGIDILSKREIHKFLKKYVDENRAAMVLTSHDIDDIENLCSKLVILDKGRIIYSGTPGELNKKYIDKKLIKIKYEEPDNTFNEFINILIDKEIKIVKDTGYELNIVVNDENIKDVKTLAAEYKNIINIEIHSLPLENILLRMYDEKVSSDS